MLHRETLPPGTLDLLISLCTRPELAPFALTGGTALALRFGHRQSVDLDFFTPEPFNSGALAESLQQVFALSDVRPGTSGLNLMIEDVKVDFVTYRYPLLEPFETIEGVRLYSLNDNIGMKLSAMTNRGAKKDFFDVYQLIEQLGLPALLEIYRAKYANHDLGMVLRSLVYFDDAELQRDPISLNNTDWSTVQASITRAVKELL